jgi:HemY protein
MLRWIVWLAFVCAAAVGAAWVARYPGTFTLEWQNYRIDSSVAVLAALVVAVALIAALAYRLVWSLRRVPYLWSRSRSEGRQRRGYEALSRGLVAVAAGDVDTARRQSRRAEALLDDRPLAMLLAAQAAQLEGDDQAAARFFAAMQHERPTAFLGVRGLLAQAIKRQDWTEALTLAERAHRLNPASDWVVSTLYDLQKRTGHWAEAESLLTQSVRLKLIAPSEAPRERAMLLLRQSEAAGGREALRLARRAVRADPAFAPASVRLAKLLVAGGRLRRAAAVIERAWERSPDAALAEVYYQARQCDDALKKVRAAQKLAARNPNDAESRITVAVAALEARLWGEARSMLEPIAGDNASARVCRLMAELEEAEHGDLARARTWLMRATAEDRPALPASPPVPAAATSG